MAEPAGIEALERIARDHGTPVFVIDHERIRHNYRRFRQHLPRVQAYYAVKANTDSGILKTLYDSGSSFDVASLSEFRLVYELIGHLPSEERQGFIWDKVIYAHTIKSDETLRELDKYKPLVTYDNPDELGKIRQHAPHAGLVLRVDVPNTGSVVELSSKFGASPGEAAELVKDALELDIGVEGLSFHVGSQCVNFQNYVQALQILAAVFDEAESRGYHIGETSRGGRRRILDIGGGFPVRYDDSVKPFENLAAMLRPEIDRLFPEPEGFEVIAEPGRFMVADAATLVAKIIGRAVRRGKTCYYLDDGVYGTFSGKVFDHCTYPVRSFRRADAGDTRLCTLFGPTCDAFDIISEAEQLPPDLKTGDFLYAENIGAYSTASATDFNGMPRAKVVHVNR